ncbi:MAG: TetR family transcriptional regulator [Actinomycetota bacterium]|nr:TetR family transcriptional regulator [Actinomycetota bacterium]
MPLRQRIIGAAAERTSGSGWSSVTMSGLAADVGVSRQTVYNEIGSKPALAAAMVGHELSLFLAAVERSFDEHPEDAVEAIRSAARAVLMLSEQNQLLRAIVTATNGADAELLPLLTTASQDLRGTAAAVLGARLARYPIPLDHGHVDMAVDGLVRLVLAYVMQPADSPEETADRIGWFSSRLLGLPSPE